MSAEKRCPECAESIQREARVCRYCGYRYSQAAMAAQQKADQEQGMAMGAGCLILLVGIGLVAYCSQSDEEPITRATIEAVAGGTENAVSNEVTAVEGAEIAEEAAPSAPSRLSPDTEAKGEVVATMLNLNGFLCARATNVVPLKVKKDVFEVTCIEYRGGTGTVQYIVDTDTGEIFKR